MDEIIYINKQIQEKFPSIYQALMANNDSIQKLNADEVRLKIELEELENKINICKNIKVPAKSLLRALIYLKKQLSIIPKQKLAYEKGYLEIPCLQRIHRSVEFTKDKYWGFRFDKNIPVRILEALEKAKETKVFDEYVVFENAGIDPILAGKIHRRYFYLGSWR